MEIRYGFPITLITGVNLDQFREAKKRLSRLDRYVEQYPSRLLLQSFGRRGSSDVHDTYVIVDVVHKTTILLFSRSTVLLFYFPFRSVFFIFVRHSNGYAIFYDHIVD